ncbi:uncharacterized protein [Magallana gigas]|uniref:uncharacterized protein n=1 Tax=Magallana gigas TaxID=29159 RepID=UPI0033424E25
MDFLIFVTILFSIKIPNTDQYENLALNKTVTLSQRYNNKDFDPSLAVDGDHSTDLLKCSLTASGQKEAWLTVDLGGEKNIVSIFFVHGGLGTNAEPMDSSVSGIYSDGTSSNIVQTMSNGGYLCYTEFTQHDGQVVCLNWGFLPDGVDVSARSPGTPSISFANRNYECVGNEAVLGDCSQNSRICNLGQRTYLTCKEGDTLAGISVYVSQTPDWRSGTLCYQHDIEQPLNNNVNIDCLTSGRYVTLFNSRNETFFPDLSAFAYINICEINIAGCDIGFYGKNCTRCPDNCLDEQCQFQIGHCVDCKDGFKGDMCEEECHQGRYGRACSFQCGNCLNQLSCDNINGSCQDGCSSGWTGDRCYQSELEYAILTGWLSFLTLNNYHAMLYSCFP